MCTELYKASLSRGFIYPTVQTSDRSLPFYDVNGKQSKEFYRVMFMCKSKDIVYNNKSDKVIVPKEEIGVLGYAPYCYAVSNTHLRGLCVIDGKRYLALPNMWETRLPYYDNTPVDTEAKRIARADNMSKFKYDYILFIEVGDV